LKDVVGCPAAYRKVIHTQQQHVKTIMKACSHPAAPTTQTMRMNRITPKMFWMHGK